MEQLDFTKYKPNVIKKLPDRKKFQLKAVEAMEFFTDINTKQLRTGFFQKWKVDEAVANIAYQDCKELNKPFVLYFFKVWHEIRKQNGKVKSDNKRGTEGGARRVIKNLQDRIRKS